MIVSCADLLVYQQRHPRKPCGLGDSCGDRHCVALGVLSLLGSRAPVRLKILLTAIAVIDDLGAILIIAFFYTSNLALEPLYFGAVALVGLAALNLRCVTRTAPYVLLGIVLWIAVLQSGIHATLAGVATALFIPVRCKKDPNITPCKTLEHQLHPWVSFIILPIFAFANAGVPFEGMGFKSLAEPTTLGIILVWLSVSKSASSLRCGLRLKRVFPRCPAARHGFTSTAYPHYAELVSPCRSSLAVWPSMICIIRLRYVWAS